MKWRTRFLEDFSLLLGVLPAMIALVGAGCSSERFPELPKTDGNEILTPIPFNEVRLTDEFWRPRLRTQQQTLVPFALEKTQPAVDNLKKAGDILHGRDGELPFPHRYISSDLYKVMEGAAYLLMENRDTALERRMDEIIDIIADAQREDGYLYVAHIAGVAKDHPAWGGGGMGDRPYSWVVHSHELYNMGHMYEAAIAYYRATGKDKWLQVAEKNAGHINRVFFEGDPNYNDGQPVLQAPGHQEIELALAKLYRLTGKALYLEMAKKFLEIRGVTYVPEGDQYLSPTYAQQHLPVAEQRTAVGHAVRAAYMYSAMAEVDALKNEQVYDKALTGIWHDIVDTKMHITGGLGAMHGIEGFGPSYELPNAEAYNETCAAVGNVFFNYRMFLRHKDARYLDVAEVALLNNALAGVNLEGNEFFYVNPLEADGVHPFNHGHTGRSPWFNTACCPSNLARLLPQVSGMMYAHTATELYVAFYGGNETTVSLAGGRVAVEQKTNYPFDGNVELVFNPEKAQKFTLRLRIPTWTGAQLVPGELYHYLNDEPAAWKVEVNGQPVEASLDRGFAVLERTWRAGDRVKLSLPMPVRFNTAIDSVEADRGRVAVTRGPLVYCAEEADNGGPVQRFSLSHIPGSEEIDIHVFSEGLLRNVVQVDLPAEQGDRSVAGRLKMIPYYAWDNRGDGSMVVWLPQKQE